MWFELHAAKRDIADDRTELGAVATERMRIVRERAVESASVARIRAVLRTDARFHGAHFSLGVGYDPGTSALNVLVHSSMNASSCSLLIRIAAIDSPASFETSNTSTFSSPFVPSSFALASTENFTCLPARFSVG